MNRIHLSDEEWVRILAKLKKLTGLHIGRQTLAGNLLAPACGYYVRDRSGGFCRLRRASGIASSSVFHAGAANSSADNGALGRSKGGFSGKIHALCDALGMPIKFILTGGQKAECQQAVPLLENVKASAVLADKAYDTDELRTWLTGRGIKAVIPPKSNRKEKIECDYSHYKERHAVE